MKLLSAFITVILLTACASLGPNFKKESFNSSSDALVYFYRPSRFFQGGGGPDVYIDGINQFRMHNGAYTFLHLKPGRHLISPKKHFNWGLDVLEKEIEVTAGREYYIRMDFKDAGVAPVVVGGFGTAEITGVTVFNMVSNELAVKEIVETKLIK
jgi:Protein of unknown function (DUF2846)